MKSDFTAKVLSEYRSYINSRPVLEMLRNITTLCLLKKNDMHLKFKKSLCVLFKIFMRWSYSIYENLDSACDCSLLKTLEDPCHNVAIS